jgi:hypothetical protein
MSSMPRALIAITTRTWIITQKVLQMARESLGGQTIGYAGSTGNASAKAPHLHFGVNVTGPEHKWSNGTPIDPYPLLLEAVK